MRTAEITRKTAETEIEVALDLDGSGAYRNATGVGFFDHMLDQLARHSLIDIAVRAEGDRHIDDHHTPAAQIRLQKSKYGNRVFSRCYSFRLY
jgi:imidazoleglycerol-phosphate dehydratase